MKDHLKTTGTLFANHVYGILLGFLVMFIAVIPSRMISHEYSTQGLIQLIAQEIATFAGLFLFFRRLGDQWNRKDEKLLPTEILIGNGVTALLWCIIVLISRFQFAPLCYQVIHIMDVIHGAEDVQEIPMEMLGREYFGQCALIQLIHAVFFFIPMNLGYYFGAKKRSDERAKLHHT
ncbi:MAG: hypothetical protein IJ334_11350 [Clostridia bacterium]|nr:hypothetical protein [Clostridia bacterium]